MCPLAPSAAAPLIAVASLSARMLAQSARQAGLRVAALDAFGDRDTRAASALWFDVGGPGLTIDRGRLVDALRRIARLPRSIGWIAGSGTEPLIDELSTLPGLPAFLGNDPQATAAVRDPRRFFSMLDELRIPHPPVSFTRPSEPGWLFKRADGCGGTHVMPAANADGAQQNEAAATAGDGRDCAPHSPGYFQRQQGGQPFSALFVAAKGRATVLGFARQLTASIGGLPYVHTGSVGPVPLPEPLGRRLREAVEAVSARAGANGLKGLNSCDFLVDGNEFSLLEINARPSSTMWLYESASPKHWPFGLLAEHLDACLRGRLAAPPGERERCAGQQVLFAPHALTCTTAFSDACFADPGCRDVPMPGVPIEAGAPLCTLVAFAASPDAVMQALARQRARVLERIDTSYEPDHVLLVKHG